MSFWPFPKTALSELRAGRVLGPGVDVGAGDGRLAARLGSAGLPLITIDNRSPAALMGDALALPFRTSSLGLCLAANLVRHLSHAGRETFFAEADRTLVAGGRFALVEDLPEADDAPALNYRRALAFLAEADPSRGTVLDLDPVLRELAPRFGEPLLDLVAQNEEPVVDAGAPLDWLLARGRGGDPGLSVLRADVAREGMRYGAFRVCVFVKQAGCAE